MIEEVVVDGFQGSDITLLFDKFMIGDALAMIDNIVIIKQAHKLLTEEHFLIKYSAELILSDFSRITEDERTTVLNKLKRVRQDFTKILVTMNSIDRAYKWYQTDKYPCTYYSLMGDQARDDLGCQIEFLFAKYRVILEYIQSILETLLPPMLNQADKTEYKQCKKSHEKFKWLTKYISEHYNNNSGLMNTDWFQDLRETRNALIHRGAACLVFGDKDKLLFNIYTPESVQSDKEIIEWDDFYKVGRNGLISYDCYWGIYFAKLIVFTNAILEFLRSISTLPTDPKEIIRHEGLNKPTELENLDGERLPSVTDIPADLLKSLLSD